MYSVIASSSDEDVVSMPSPGKNQLAKSESVSEEAVWMV